jgi:molybdopterin converting factor small subunit
MDPAQTLEIRVIWHALLREERGCDTERVETRARTPLALYRELAALHRIDVPAESLRFAVNNEIVPGHAQLSGGDEVAVLPPVSGG